MPLFLASEFLDLAVAENDEEFEGLQMFRKLVEYGFISRDAVLECSGTRNEHGREIFQIYPLQWSRLRRHEFFSYVNILHRQYNTEGGSVEAHNEKKVGGIGDHPYPKPLLRRPLACPSEAVCKHLGCWEDGVCRGDGELIAGSKT